MELLLSADNPHLAEIALRKSSISAMRDGKPLFHGHVVGTETDTDGNVLFSCVSALSYLMDSIQPSIDFDGYAVDLFAVLLDKHNDQVESRKQFAVGSVTRTGLGSSMHFESSAGATTWDCISKIIDEHGGYLFATEGAALRLNWANDSDYFAPIPCKYGENILEISVEYNTDDLITSVVAVGKNDIAGTATDADAQAIYGKIAGFAKCDAETQSGVNAFAEAYLAERCEAVRTVTVKAIGDGLFAPWNVGDFVNVKSQKHGVDDWIICAEKEIDLSAETPDTVNLGKIADRMTNNPRVKTINAWLSTVKDRADTAERAVDRNNVYAVSDGMYAVAGRS